MIIWWFLWVQLIYVSASTLATSGLLHSMLFPNIKDWVNIGSGNGLSPVRRQAITWTNADSLSIGPLETNFSQIPIEIQNFSFMKIHVNMSSVK